MSNTHIVGTVLEVPIEEIYPNNWNPKESIEENVQNKEKFEALKRSIQEFGYNDYIKTRTVTNIHEIVDGYHRWRACRELGFEKLVVIDYGNITRERAIQIALHTMYIRIEPSTTLTGTLLKNLQDQGIDIKEQVLPFDGVNLEKLLQSTFN